MDQGGEAVHPGLDGGRPNVGGSQPNLRISQSALKSWRCSQATGRLDLLDKQNTHVSYPSTHKLQAVEAYLRGEGSQLEIVERYGLRSATQLRRWIRKYTEGDILKSTSGGRIVMPRRKTSQEERIEITQYCLIHERNYRAAAERYKVSYQQVYSWVRKYSEGREAALTDKRGRRKQADELTEVDRIRRDLKLLKAANRKLEVENALLKNCRNSRESLTRPGSHLPHSHRADESARGRLHAL